MGLHTCACGAHMRVGSLHGAGQLLEPSHWPALKELRVYNSTPQMCPAAWLSV